MDLDNIVLILRKKAGATFDNFHVIQAINKVQDEARRMKQITSSDALNITRFKQQRSAAEAMRN